MPGFFSFVFMGLSSALDAGQTLLALGVVESSGVVWGMLVTHSSHAHMTRYDDCMHDTIM